MLQWLTQTKDIKLCHCEKAVALLAINILGALWQIKVVSDNYIKKEI